MSFMSALVVSMSLETSYSFINISDVGGPGGRVGMYRKQLRKNDNILKTNKKIKVKKSS